MNITRTAVAMSLLFIAHGAVADVKLSYAGEYTVPDATRVDGHTVSGLSALAWDAKDKVFYAINDNRNTEKEGEASLYSFTMALTAKGISGVHFLTRRPLLNDDGTGFPASTVDAEGLALTPDGQSLMWSSELGSPLRLSDKHGVMRKAFPEAPGEKFALSEGTTGVRKNASWESLSFTPDGKNLFMATESSLKQDGNVATPVHSGTSRLIKFSTTATDMQPVPQQEYLYVTDAVPQVTPYGVNDNGVSDILAISDTRLLFVERSGRNVSKGFNDWDFSVRVYLADIAEATDISKVESLSSDKETATLQTAKKKLLIDFSALTSSPDNIEGVTFGPLIDGKKTLVFVSDNNQQPHQKTKFYLFIDEENTLK